MLTKGKSNSLRIAKYALTVIALLAVVVMCLTACGKKVPTAMEYVANSLADTSYEVGDVFDVTGAQVKVTYEDGKEETLDVTQEMVGTVVLDKIGTVNIPVSYTVDGVTVTTVITIEVADPHAAEKETAVNRINGNSAIAANPTDKGVATLVAAYITKVENAGSVAAIDTIVGMFESELKTYVDAKNAVLAKFDTVDVTAIYAQYKDDIAAKKQTNIANARSAASVEAAEEFFAAYESAVAAQIAYQELIEKANDEQTLNARKLALADRINAAIQKANDLNAIVSANLTDPADADLLETYNTLYTGTSAKLEVLKYWVLITLSLDGADSKVPEIEALIEGIKTPIDYIYDALKGGHRVLPKAYVLDATTNIYALSTEDATATLIAQINEWIVEAEKMFGATEATNMLAAYDHDEDVTTAAYNLSAVIFDIKAKKTELDLVQAEAVAVINKIAAIANAADAAAKKVALDEAWAAVETWTAANSGRSMKIKASAVVGLYPTLEYTDKYADNFVGFDATEKFVDSAFDKAYIVTYFVYNVDELIDSAIEFDFQVVVDLVEDIRDIVVSYTDRDSQAEITAAKTAIDNFKTQYGVDAYDEHCEKNSKDLTKMVEDAQKAYDERKAWADEVIGLIANLPANIKLSDYDNQMQGEEGALYLAYTEYMAFAAANTVDNVVYTDIVDQADAADTANANKVKLSDAVDSYIDQKFAEQRRIQSDLIISAALIELDKATNASDHNAIRQQAQQLAQDGRNEITTNDTLYGYVEDADRDATFATENRIDNELQDNLAKIVSAANEKAAAIVDLIPTV